MSISFLKTPRLLLVEYFSLFKNHIDLAYETSAQSETDYDAIKKERFDHEKLIDEINKLEAKCLLRIPANKTDFKKYIKASIWYVKLQLGNFLKSKKTRIYHSLSVKEPLIIVEKFILNDLKIKIFLLIEYGNLSIMKILFFY